MGGIALIFASMVYFFNPDVFSSPTGGLANQWHANGFSSGLLRNHLFDGKNSGLVPVKLIDHDGDGKPDEDREPSNFSGVAFVVGKGMGQSTAFRVGRRHAIMAAHAGDNDDTGAVYSMPGRERLKFQGCRTETYTSVRKVCGTDNTWRDWQRDFCVVEVDRDICPAAEVFAIGYPEDRRSILNLELKATGFYPEDVIGAKAIESQIDSRFWISCEALESELPPKTSSLKQFTSTGKIFGYEMIDQGRIDYYQMGQNYGGSGGPIFFESKAGEKVAVGIQFAHSCNAHANYNYSISIVGSVLDFFVTHVPDVQVHSDFSN